MKRMKFLALGFAALFMGSFLLTSCGNDEEAVGPTVSIISEAGYIAADADVAPGDTVKIKVNITKGDASISKLDFTRDGISLSGDGYPMTSGTMEGEVVFASKAPLTEATYEYQIVVTDGNDKKETKAFKITVKATQVADLTEYTGVVLGAQSNAAGSAYYTSSNTVASVNSATAASVDFIYYYGANNKATLAAPADADLQTVYAGVASWTTKNDTKISLASGIDYATITSSSQIGDNPTGSDVNDLAVNDVVYFKTAAGKKGIAKVTAISSADINGAITLSVKIQE